MEVNYSNYDAKGLLEALSTIDSKAYPENYKNLTSEISSRQAEIDEFHQMEAERTRIKWTRAFTGLGLMQTATAIIATAMLLFSFSGVVTVEYVAAIFVILLNGSAGYAILRKKPRFYFLSYINQSLQVIAVGIGGYYINYHGLGGIYLMTDWVSESYSWFSASFNLGGSLFEYSNQYELGFIQIDLLAIFFIWTINKALSVVDS